MASNFHDQRCPRGGLQGYCGHGGFHGQPCPQGGFQGYCSHSGFYGQPHLCGGLQAQHGQKGDLGPVLNQETASLHICSETLEQQLEFQRTEMQKIAAENQNLQTKLTTAQEEIQKFAKVIRKFRTDTEAQINASKHLMTEVMVLKAEVESLNTLWEHRRALEQENKVLEEQIQQIQAMQSSLTDLTPEIEQPNFERRPLGLGNGDSGMLKIFLVLLLIAMMVVIIVNIGFIGFCSQCFRYTLDLEVGFSLSVKGTYLGICFVTGTCNILM